MHSCKLFLTKEQTKIKTGKMTIKSFDMKSETVLIIIEMYIGVCTREKGRLIVLLLHQY